MRFIIFDKILQISPHWRLIAFVLFYFTFLFKTVRGGGSISAKSHKTNTNTWLFILPFNLIVILEDLKPTKQKLSLRTGLHLNCVCVCVSLSLPLPSVRVYTSFLWAPGQTLLFIFPSKSNESHMHAHANAHFCIYTLPQTPLHLKTVNPSF